MPSDGRPARVAVVGAGRHGARVAAALVADGYELAGLADPAHAGAAAATLIGVPCAARPVAADVAALLAGAPAPDVAIIAAPVDLDQLQAMAGALLDAGADVLTLHPGAFDPPPAWAAAVDARARAAGVSFLATGVQDTWHVHVPAAAAGAVRALRSIAIASVVDAGELWPGFGEWVGIGRPAGDFARIRTETLLRKPPVLGDALRVLARRLGLTPGPVELDVEPVIAAHAMTWASAATVVAAGRVAGFDELTRVATHEGVELRGRVRAALLDPGTPIAETIDIAGDPDLHIVNEPFPGDRVTDTIAVARVRDILAAPPGLHTAATLPPAGFHPRPAAAPDRPRGLRHR